MLSKEFQQAFFHKRVKHGQKKRGDKGLEYSTWLAIKSRCTNPKNKDYRNWGGRGIKVCERWDNSFVAFLDDMGTRPTPKHQIDRIDPNGNYELNNCRWVTPEVQGGENKRTNVPIIVDGTYYKTTLEACRVYGVSQSTFNMRIAKGATPEQAMIKGRLRLTRPVRGVPR